MRDNTIEVEPYNEKWPNQFDEESSLLKEALGNSLLSIHHVGSTSVLGLSAKPKIDILAVVDTLEGILPKLEPLGYTYRGEFNIPLHDFFRKRGKYKVNLHILPEGHAEIELNLTFRNALRKDSTIRNEYAQLKQDLLKHPSSFEKNDSMFVGYNLGKDAFIRKVLKAAGFSRLRFLICVHSYEWDAVKSMRQRYFFKGNDPYQWTFNHPEHLHLVLDLGLEVIGYAHIQLWPDSRAAMRIIVIEEEHRGNGYGRQFLQSIEQWLKRKGITTLHAEASPASLAFYGRCGYAKMDFNDPDGYESDPKDTPIGKVL